MIQTVVSVGFPLDETLRIQKNRLIPEGGLRGGEKRISIVTGTHGDELEGQYVCYELQRRIGEYPEHLTGIVDVYPALNPLGIDSITRGIPAFDLDMNRIFPGEQNGAMPEYIAAGIMEDLTGSDMVIDIHASNIFLREIPQVRINTLSRDALVPYARKLNVDFIWIHAAATVLESTLAYSLNSVGTPTLVVEMGVGMRITKDYGNQLVEGILALMRHMGIWTGPAVTPKEPIISEDGEVSFLNAGSSGVFVPAVEHWKDVKKGQHIGDILNPLTGAVAQRIAAGVFEQINDYRFGIHFTSFYMQGSFIPHVRMMKTGFEDVTSAGDFGLPYIYRRDPKPYDTTTLNYNWQIWNTKAFSIYSNATDRIEPAGARTVIEAVLRFLGKQGILQYSGHGGFVSQLIEGSSMVNVKTNAAGFFLRQAEVNARVKKGDILARIVDPYSGKTIEEIASPVDGIAFFHAAQPVIHAHTSLFRIIPTEEPLEDGRGAGIYPDYLA